MSLRVCSKPGCPVTVERTGYCPPHALEARREQEDGRPSRQERGYGAEHERERKRWAPIVAKGKVKCARCNKPIRKGQNWHLDHSDDRSGYLGPAHEKCNVLRGRDERQ